MVAQVFISHSSKDRKVARTICSALEGRGLSCWIASRDVGPGESFMDAIVQAIGTAKVMVLVFSENANNSDEIKREVVLAGNAKVTVIPVRVEDVVPKGAFAYQFATRQWIDLFDDWENQIERLATWISGVVILGSTPNAATADAEPKAAVQTLIHDAPFIAPDTPTTHAKAVEDEAQRKKDEAEAQRLAEERRQQEEADKRRADDEESRKLAEAEAARRAEEERSSREADIKQRGDQERAFAAAKLADTVGAMDAFLAAHPDSHLADEAKSLRVTLVERDEVFSEAMRSDDPTLLKAFLERYPKSKPADEVRSRLRRLEPRQPWQPSRRTVVVGGSVLGAGALTAVIGIVNRWSSVTPTVPPATPAVPTPSTVSAPPPTPAIPTPTAVPAPPVATSIQTFLIRTRLRGTPIVFFRLRSHRMAAPRCREARTKPSSCGTSQAAARSARDGAVGGAGASHGVDVRNTPIAESAALALSLLALLKSLLM